MKKKTIVCFVGLDGVGKTTAANVLSKEGFYKISLLTKVEEFANYLFSSEELSENKDSILKKVKKRGNDIYGGYWLNLILMAIPETKNLIVIDDLEEEDVKFCSIIKPIEICKNKEKRLFDDIIIVENDGDLKSFKEKIKTLAKKISK